MNGIYKAIRNAFSPSKNRVFTVDTSQMKFNKLYVSARKGGENPLFVVPETPTPKSTRPAVAARVQTARSEVPGSAKTFFKRTLTSEREVIEKGEKKITWDSLVSDPFDFQITPDRKRDLGL